MKWLWIGFGIVWGLSVWLDSRRRRRTPHEDDASTQVPIDLEEASVILPAREAA